MYVSRLSSKKSLWPSKVDKINIEPGNVLAWKLLFEETNPKLSSVLGLHSAMLDNGLEVLIEMLKDIKPGNTISRKMGKSFVVILHKI